MRVDSVFTTVMPAFETVASGDVRVCQDLPANLTAGRLAGATCGQLAVRVVRVPEQS